MPETVKWFESHGFIVKEFVKDLPYDEVVMRKFQ